MAAAVDMMLVSCGVRGKNRRLGGALPEAPRGPDSAARGAPGAGLPIRYFRRHGLEARRTGSHSSMHYTGARGIRGKGGAGGARPQIPAGPPGMSQLLLPAAFGAASLAVRAWPRRDRGAWPYRARRTLSALSRSMPLPSRATRSVKSVRRGPPGLAWPGVASPRRPAPDRPACTIAAPCVYLYGAPAAAV